MYRCHEDPNFSVVDILDLRRSTRYVTAIRRIGHVADKPTTVFCYLSLTVNLTYIEVSTVCEECTVEHFSRLKRLVHHYI